MGRFVRSLASALLGLVLGISGGMMAWDLTGAHAQNAPPAQTCEQQLHDAQRVILQLRKANAQSEFQNVTLQERILQMETAPKAATAPTPARPAAAEKGK